MVRCTPLLLSFVLFITLICFSLLLSGQDFAVTLRNDTLRGKVKIMSYDIIDRIQVTEGKKKSHFTAVQLKSVQVENQLFGPVRTEYGYQMMKLLKAGFLSLYVGRGPNSALYDVQYLVKRDGNTQEVPKLSFKKSMADFLGDCSVVKEKITQDELGKKQLDQIIEEYNACRMPAQANIRPSVTEPTDSATERRLMALMDLKSKLEKSTLDSRLDALDIINNISEKVKRNQTIPNYLLESLTGLLKNTPDFQSDLEKVLTSLKSPLD